MIMNVRTNHPSVPYLIVGAVLLGVKPSLLLVQTHLVIVDNNLVIVFLGPKNCSPEIIWLIYVGTCKCCSCSYPRGPSEHGKVVSHLNILYVIV